MGATVRNASSYLQRLKMNEEREMVARGIMGKMSPEQLSELLSFYHIMGNICSEVLDKKLSACWNNNLWFEWRYDLLFSILYRCKKKKKLLFCYLLFAAFVWLRLVSNQISMLSSFFFMYHDMIFSSHFPEKKSHEVNEKLFITISLHFTTVFTQNIWNLCRISYNFLVNWWIYK